MTQPAQHPDTEPREDSEMVFEVDGPPDEKGYSHFTAHWKDRDGKRHAQRYRADLALHMRGARENGRPTRAVYRKADGCQCGEAYGTRPRAVAKCSYCTGVPDKRPAFKGAL